MSDTILFFSIMCLTLVTLAAIGSGNKRTAEKIIEMVKPLFNLRPPGHQ